MSACLYVRMPVCPHACMSACLYVRMPVCPHACMSAWLYVRMPVCPHACMSACMCPHVCMSACLYVRMPVCPHACMSACLYVRMPVYRHPLLHLKFGISGWKDGFQTQRLMTTKKDRKPDMINIRISFLHYQFRQISFVLATLSKRGFCQQWRQIAEGDWIKNCVCISLCRNLQHIWQDITFLKFFVSLHERYDAKCRQN
jgi:hypothetical protein